MTPYTDPKTLLDYPSQDWMFEHISTLPEVQKAYPERFEAPASSTVSPEQKIAPVKETNQIEIPSGATLSGLATQYGTTIEELQKLNPQIKDPNLIYAGSALTVPGKAPEIPEVFQKAGITAPLGSTEATEQILAKGESLLKSFSTVASSEDLKMGMIDSPELTDQTSLADTASFTRGLMSDLDNKRSALDTVLSQQIDKLSKKSADLETKIKDIETAQKGIIETDVKAATQPFREQLEKTERERLRVEANFFANQNSVQELETLLTQSLTEIQRQEGITGLAGIRVPRIAKVKEDLAARVGIIEAVMAVRNNQIVVAENMIDRSIAAIEGDRRDQLTYYSTLLDFYENQKDDAGKRLVDLSNDEKTFVDAQIALLEHDFSESERTVNYIKDLMVDPETANVIEQAGVKLNDTVEEIQLKFADFSYSQEVIGVDNAMELEGYQRLGLPEQIASKDEAELVRLKDSKGVERVYWKEPEAEDVGADFRSVSGVGVVRLLPGGGYEVVVPEKKSTTGLDPRVQTQVDALAKGFDSSPIVKQFVEVQNKSLSIGDIIDAGVGGPGDLALVYEFMRALDPTSVVRESEYATAAKSGNIFVGAYTRFNGYFKEEGGFMPDTVKEGFRDLIDIKFDVIKKQYINLYDEAGRKINRKTGDADGLDYLTNYDFVGESSVTEINSYLEDLGY